MGYQESQQRRGIIARTQSLLNLVISPESRSQIYANINSFAQDQPYLFSFLALLTILSSTPLFLFASFTLTTLLVSLTTLLVSLTTALVFSLFWIGVALLFLIPALFVAGSFAIGVWTWAVVSFVVLRWVYGMLPLGVSGVAEIHPTLNGVGGQKKVVIVKGEGLSGDVKVQG